MKAQKFIFTLLAGVAVMLVSCKEPPYILPPGDGSHNQDTVYVAPDTPIADSLKNHIPEGALNVHEAYKLGIDLGSGGTSKEKHYIYGWVTSLQSKHADGMAQYGNGTFYISANKDGMQDDTFEAYQVYGRDGKKFTADQAEAVQPGDFVIIYGLITNYSGTTIETTGKGAAYVYYSTNPLW